jgi:glycosyltransferase involved in cell wall biosynthesis
MINRSFGDFERVLFYLPEFVADPGLFHRAIERLRFGKYSHVVDAAAQLLGLHSKTITTIFGGALNIMRHGAIAKGLGVDVRLATPNGKDTYGSIYGIPRLQFTSWKDSRASDLCLVPDIFTYLIPKLNGTVIAYQQSPRFIRNDFDHRASNVRVWTDSPEMLRLCNAAFPGIDIPIVPNIIDDSAFAFVSQAKRTRGELIAFPRKGPDFIENTMTAYERLGGQYWKLQLVDGLSFGALVERFRTPQAFLASAELEGCALPPQEAMASGIAVVGRNANGANFCMVDGETSLVANTPEEAARALIRLEDDVLREQLTTTAYHRISRWFPRNEPSEFWTEVLRTCARPRSSGEKATLVSSTECQLNSTEVYASVSGG